MTDTKKTCKSFKGFWCNKEIRSAISNTQLSRQSSGRFWGYSNKWLASFTLLCVFGALNIGYAQTTTIYTADFNTWTLTDGGDVDNFEVITSGDGIEFSGLELVSDDDCAWGLATSPTIDLTGYENITVSLDLDLESKKTSATIQYSTDGGSSWLQLGDVGEGTNWYNDTNTGCDASGRPIDAPFTGWEDTTNSNVSLDCINGSISNNATVKFRIYLTSRDDDDESTVGDFVITGVPVTGTNLSTGPGGITSGLSLWLRADTESMTYADGVTVSSWDDKVEKNTAYAEESSSQPTFYNNATQNINFNPVLSFDGTSYLKACGGMHTNEIFVVTKPTNTITNTSGATYLLGIDDPATTTTSGDVSGIHFGDATTKISSEVISFNLETASSGYLIAETGTTSYSHVSILNVSNNSTDDGSILHANGNLISTTQVNASRFTNLSDTRYWLAKTQSTTPNYSGDITEVISYSSRLGVTDRQKVESYLAIKHGITLGINGISKNYLDSGSNIIWDSSLAGSFNHDIFGIGRDDDSSLLQKQSRSSNPGDIVTIGREDIANTNDANMASFSADKNFVLVANDGGNISSLSASVIDLGYVKPPLTTIGRKWKVKESGDVGTLKIRIASTDISASLAVSGTESYVILMADDAGFSSNLQIKTLTEVGGNLDFNVDLPADSETYFTFGKAPLHLQKADVLFDGIDDQLSVEGRMSGYSNVTLMGFVKPATSYSNNGYVCGQQAFNIGVNSSRQIFAEIITNTNTSPILITGSHVLPADVWAHISATYNGATGALKLYLNGELEVETTTDTGIVGTDASLDAALKIGGRDSSYFRGNIDEVRVFNVDLTTDQIQKVMYQEVEDNAGNLRGSTIPRDVEGLSYSSLVQHYDLNLYRAASIIDRVNATASLSFNNFTLNQATEAQTAPMPFVTSSNGAWQNSGTWQAGSAWDISLSSHKDWAVVEINHDITSSESHQTLGLLIHSGKHLTVNSDYMIGNSWYLSLEGTLDLLADSQLMQTETSQLSCINGMLKRRQEGNGSVYRYSYYGAPVSDFSMDKLRLGDESLVNFCGTHHEIGKLSTYWIYTYKGVTYWEWKRIPTTEVLSNGIGYIHKGTGLATQQQFLWQGKPNNGQILVPAIDTGGPGSVPVVTKTEYLLGNPYPSALDIHQFIDDNAGVISGPLQLWEQWGGNSHVLREYEGGYATVTKVGSVRAYQFEGIEGANTGEQNGTLTPTRYLPVGQGFMVEVVADGDIEFNNNQRRFIKEADADGNYENGSVFFKSTQESKKAKHTDTVKRLRVLLEIDNVPYRELLIAFSKKTTDAFDYGYDAKMDKLANNDIAALAQDEKYLIHAYEELTSKTVVPLVFNTTGESFYNISITEYEGVDENQEVYLYDSYLNTYHNLRSERYTFNSNRGVFNDRFSIVFQAAEDKLLNTDKHENKTLVKYQPKDNKLQVLGLKGENYSLALFNIQGQKIMSNTSCTTQQLIQGVKLPSALASGTYISVLINTENENRINKKIIVP